ncbi:flagellar basal body P-ring protein FlgI [candidate division KSB1 bacterium]
MKKCTYLSRFRRMTTMVMLFVLVSMPLILSAQSRVKDIVHYKGLENQRITGLGLVSGLTGTGDGTQIIYTIQAVANLLKQAGITVDQNRLRQRNVAFVSVYVDVKPFTKRGSLVDVVVSSMGDASSLEGGVLMQTYLYDAPGNIIAIAEGPVTIGGLNQAAGVQNFSTTGRVLKGAQLMADLEQTFQTNNNIALNLYQPDFTTAFRIANTINEEFGDNTARAVDPATVSVTIQPPFTPPERHVEFVSMIEQLTLETDLPAKVIINEKTGTVIAGQDVRLDPVMISHGGLTIAIQPPAGAPAGAPATQAAVVVLDARTGNSVQDLAAALNALQVTPRDLISIFQALKAHGSLKADLEII